MSSLDNGPASHSAIENVTLSFARKESVVDLIYLYRLPSDLEQHQENWNPLLYVLIFTAHRLQSAPEGTGQFRQAR